MTTTDSEELRDPAEIVPAPAHRRGTDTERDAAHLVTPRAGTLRARVIDQLRRGSFTAAELATALDEYLYSVAPRVTELQRGGWVEDSGERRDTVRARAAIVWRLTAEAVDLVGERITAADWSDVDVDLGIEP